MNKEHNNIILIGFMGSGKTTFGRWIAKSHSMKFLDTDEYIEKKYNKFIVFILYVLISIKELHRM